MASVSRRPLWLARRLVGLFPVEFRREYGREVLRTLDVRAREVRERPPILVSGIAQFQLVHIHPFLDGNGRASRLLSTLCLYRTGYDFKRLFTISEFYDRDRSAFYRALQSVRRIWT